MNVELMNTILFFWEKGNRNFILKNTNTAKQKTKLKEDLIGKQHPHPRVNLLPKFQDLQIKLLS